MHVDEAGIDFIRECEGCELEPYLDSAGLMTVGIGHLLSGPDDPWNRTITMDEAEGLLAEDVVPPEDVINENVIVEINQNHFNAMASLAFNIGTGAFRDSTLLRVLNEGSYQEAADQFLVWNKITVDGEKVVSEGLNNRREKERALFLEPVDLEAPAPAPVLPSNFVRVVSVGSDISILSVELTDFNLVASKRRDRKFIKDLLALIDKYEKGAK